MCKNRVKKNRNDFRIQGNPEWKIQNSKYFFLSLFYAEFPRLLVLKEQ